MKCNRCGQTAGTKNCCQTGEKHYIFNWRGCGYNTTKADDKEDALRKATLRGDSGDRNRLIPDPSSFEIWTIEREEKEERACGPFD